MGECSEKIACNYAEPYRATRMWTDIVMHFESKMAVSRHWRQFKVYNDSFTGTEAVNFLFSYLQHNPNFGLSVSRFQAVRLLQKLHRARVFEDVRGAKYDRESFSESNNRLFQLCKSQTGPRSPFSYCRALLNGSRTDLAGHQNNISAAPGWRVKFDEKENEKVFNSKETEIFTDIPVKQSLPVLKENQSLFGALQSPLLPVSGRIPSYASKGVKFKMEDKPYLYTTRNSEGEEQRSNASQVMLKTQRKPFQLVNGTLLPPSVEPQNVWEMKQEGVMTVEQNFRGSGIQEKNRRVSSEIFEVIEKENLGQKYVTRKDSSYNTVDHRTEFQNNGGLRSVVHHTLSLWKKPLTGLMSKAEKKRHFFEEFESLLCKILAVDDLLEFYVSCQSDEENVLHNLTADNSRCPDEEFFPSWVCLAMRYLAQWPDEAVGSLPKYLGFEKDVFQAVVDYFEDPDLEPIFTKRLCQVISNVLVYLKLPISAVSCKFGQHLDTSCGLKSDESQSCFVEQQKGCRTILDQRVPLCSAQPPIVSPPSVICSNPISLVTSSLDLSQRRDDLQHCVSSKSHLQSMPDISFMGKPLFDSIESHSYPRESENGNGFESYREATSSKNMARQVSASSSVTQSWFPSSKDCQSQSSDVMRSRPVLWDRSQSIVHLPLSEYQPENEANNCMSTYFEKSRSCAHLASRNQNVPTSIKLRQCSSHVVNKNCREKTSLFFLTRAASRGAVTASYRMAVDKNSSFSTPLGKSLFRGAACHDRSSDELEKERRFLDALRLLSLLLSPQNRCRLLILLRFLGNLSLNKQLVLDEQSSIWQTILKSFSNAIFSFDNPILNQELTEVLINNSDAFAEAPKLLKLAAGDFKRSSQEIDTTSKCATEVAVKDIPVTTSVRPACGSSSAKLQVHDKKTLVRNNPIRRLKSIRF